MFLCGLINFIFDFLTLNWVDGAIDTTIIIIGLFGILIEYKMVLIPTRLVKYLREDARFLFRPYGRPAVYCFGGTFIVSKGAFLQIPLDALNLLAFENFCLGVCVIFIAVLIAYHTYIAQGDLHRIRETHIDFNVSFVRSVFTFYVFLLFLFLIYNLWFFFSQQLSIAFNKADKSANGKLSTTEFIEFMVTTFVL